MSITTIQFGQCGNQIGYEWYSTLAKDIQGANQNLSNAQNTDYEVQSMDRWFFQGSGKNELTARTVLVDTEQKVIKEIHKNQLAAHSWKYNPENIVAPKDGGSGNNWAYGYGCKGSQMEEVIMDCVRKEAERSDRLIGILNLLSSAGGTGSGVGSYIIECLRNEYPTKTIVNAIVFPYQAGEIVTQNYNTLLTLAKVYDVSDMHIIFQNDHLHKMCTTLLKVNDIGLKDLNALIALKMSSVLQPAENGMCRYLPDVVTHLTSHPGFKFVTIKTAPHIPKESAKYETGFKWNTLIQHMMQTLRVCSLSEESVMDWELKMPVMKRTSRHSLMQYLCSVSNLLITRGSGIIESQDIVDLNDPSHYPKWIPSDCRLKHCHQNRRLLNMDKFISLVTNNTSVHCILNNIVEKAWNIYSHNAYLHQYSKFNVDREEFLDTFAKVESVVKLYREMH